MCLFQFCFPPCVCPEVPHEMGPPPAAPKPKPMPILLSPFSREKVRLWMKCVFWGDTSVNTGSLGRCLLLPGAPSLSGPVSTCHSRQPCLWSRGKTTALSEHLPRVSTVTGRLRSQGLHPPGRERCSLFSLPAPHPQQARQEGTVSLSFCFGIRGCYPSLGQGVFTTGLSRFSCVQLCETPQTAAHQAPLSLGFSRQEHWSGLPFPSPMHESEK